MSPGVPKVSPRCPQGLPRYPQVSPRCPQVSPGTPSCPSVPVPVPDWCHLRVGGLTVAAVLSVLGVVVLLSGKCKCRSKARCRHPPPELSPLAGTGA
ncbi:FXYD domain-containing ion transport regulator 3 isoform X5 [Taeniopygia guttata]|uniref:FXYD domain-containing ion transport regulator 3 isoform X5 n=1 Tax=Taeniopygia guttata TaxID=59729 RepID=UPI003BB8AFD4